LVFGIYNYGPYSLGESLRVNGQSGRLYSGAVAADEWGIFSFQFDQPFTFQISLLEATDPSDTLDDGQVSLYMARIYTSAPTSCGLDYQTGYYGLCSDPNYVSADILGSIQTVPEPNTIYLAACAALGWFALRVLSYARC
jgi:hypothetical protein